MNQEEINKAFEALIAERGVHNRLRLSSGVVRNMRYNMAKGIPVSTDLKLEWLKKSGWQEEAASFTRADLISLMKHYERSSAAARENGPEYILEKWLLKNK